MLFTRDDDLLAEARRRQTEGNAFAGVVYAHKLNATVGDCVRDLEMIAEVADAEYFDSRVEYLPM